MKVAVTGAGGFIGSAVCPLLAQEGHEVRRIDRNAIRIDAHAVVHLAAANVDLAVEVGRAAAQAGAQMLFVSTLKVYGEQSDTPLHEDSPLAPRDAYARSKARAEEALRAIPGLRLTILRPPLVYGPGVRANFLALLGAVARGVPLPLAGVENRRSLLYVGNLAHAIERCITQRAAEGRTYVVSDGAAVSTAALCRQLGEALDRPARLFSLPSILIPPKLRRCLVADDAALRRELGWRPPFTLQEGVGATARWYLSR